MELKKLTVLLVDSTETIRKITNDYLRKFGFGRVLLADNGKQALSILKYKQVDLIICESDMPVMDGLGLLTELRQNTQFKSLPFLMLTSDANRDKVTTAIRKGVTDLIIKPFTIGLLQSRVMAAVEGKVRNRVKDEQECSQRSNTGMVIEKSSILVVDDLVDNLTLIGDLLKDDYRVKLVKDGKTALTICQSESPPDLVLLDIMMPEMDGYEVLRLMGQHPTSQQIPVIFVTALNEEQDQLLGLKEGAVDYITKPISPQLLKLRVRNLLRTVIFRKNLQADYDKMLSDERVKVQFNQLLNQNLSDELSQLRTLNSALTNEVLSHSAQHINEDIKVIANQMTHRVKVSSALYQIESDNFTYSPEYFSLYILLHEHLPSIETRFAEKMLHINLYPNEQDVVSEFDVKADVALCELIIINMLTHACHTVSQGSELFISLLKNQTDVCSFNIKYHGVLSDELIASYWCQSNPMNEGLGIGYGTDVIKALAEIQGISVELQVNQQEQTIEVSLLFNL